MCVRARLFNVCLIRYALHNFKCIVIRNSESLLIPIYSIRVRVFERLKFQEGTHSRYTNIRRHSETERRIRALGNGSRKTDTINYKFFYRVHTYARLGGFFFFYYPIRLSWRIVYFYFIQIDGLIARRLISLSLLKIML